MTLHQHFGNAGTTAKVTINLERRMCIEHVGISTAILILDGYVGRFQFQLILDEFVGVVAIQQSGPQTNLPSHRPTSRSIATTNERLADSSRSNRIVIGRYLTTGEEAPEVRYVAMVAYLAVPVLEPLLQLTVFAYHHRWQLTANLV